MASGPVLAGLVFLALGFIASGVSFCAPYWLYNHNNYQDMGLWGHGYCGRDQFQPSDRGEYEQLFGSCEWRWAWEEDWAWEKDKFNKWEWFVATQGLFGLGVVILLFGFMVGCTHLCCGCGKETRSILVGVGIMVLFAVFLITVAMILFGIFAWMEMDASVHSSTYRFNWAFYLAIGGLFLSALSAVLYLVESCRGRSHSGYQRGDVV